MRISCNLLAFEHGILSPRRVWCACRRAIYVHHELIFCCPSALGFAPGEAWDACAVGNLGSPYSWSLCCPSGTRFRRPAEFGTPVRRAARRGLLWGYAQQSAAKHRAAGLGRHRRYNRRAESHGYPSLTARQSRDLLVISGRVDFVNTPAHHASPTKHPQEGLSITSVWRGRRGSCSGSFPPLLRAVRRSPSAPRKCLMTHLLWIKSVSANYPDNNYTVKTGRWIKLLSQQ